MILFGFLLALPGVKSQVDCDSVDAVFQLWNERLDRLNTQDPELISLHYLFLQDVVAEIQLFQKQTIPQLSHCLHRDFYLTMAAYKKVAFRVDTLSEILTRQKSRVDHIFYQRAAEELLFGDTSQAIYNLDRALQFNKYQPEALLAKSKIMLAQGQYQESVDLVHTLYTQAILDDEMEKNISDFTIILYDKLYNKGTSLVNTGHSADALEVFLALEQFCSNMPSGYCNDDYYRGILLSRKGVYESYIAIAKEAEKRHNIEMAKKFYRYADEYKQTDN